MRSAEDIQAYLNTYTVKDTGWKVCNNYLVSKLGLDRDYKFIFQSNLPGVSFEEFMDFINSEPEPIQEVAEKTERELLSDILDEIRGIHEILKPPSNYKVVDQNKEVHTIEIKPIKLDENTDISN